MSGFFSRSSVAHSEWDTCAELAEAYTKNQILIEKISGFYGQNPIIYIILVL